MKDTALRANPDFARDALIALLERTTELPASELARIVTMVGEKLGATSARLFIADYALVSLQEVGTAGPVGIRQPIEGTLAGRAVSKNEIVVSEGQPALVWIPVSDGGERLGVLELAHDSWTADLLKIVEPLSRVLALELISRRRFTDVFVRSRRTQPLSPAAEMQWELLPPLTCVSSRVSISGILEPAYSIGGDSFDFALNPTSADFAIVDAVGHGVSAVLMSVIAINSLRNARRERLTLENAYHQTGALLRQHFGNSKFVTGQLGSLALDTGELKWLNAGHPLPLLVRNGSFAGELKCKPSLPMGLGAPVREVVTERLQPGDRVLFYTDGVTENRSPEGNQFGMERLADFLVRATLDKVEPAETVRRLSASIMNYNGEGLSDDATMLLIDYIGPGEASPQTIRLH